MQTALGKKRAEEPSAALTHLGDAISRAITTLNLKLGLGRSSELDVLPGIDTSFGIPPDARTMVVMPAIFASISGVKESLLTIERHYLANQDENIFFALLGDWKAAPRAELPDDPSLLNAARRGIEELNERYSDGPHERFHLFHRRRIWNATERDWQGGEKKRGKLSEFDRLLHGATDTSYTIATADPGFLKEVRFVLSLDSDSELPRDTARKFIGTLLHPLNRTSKSDSIFQVPPLASSTKADVSQLPLLLSRNLATTSRAKTSLENMTLSVRLNARATWHSFDEGSANGLVRRERLLVWTMAAHDLGAISRIGLLERMESTLGETSANEVEVPQHILLSETGNLAAFLRALPQRCYELSLQPIFDKRLFDGLSDTLVLMKNELRNVRTMTPGGLHDLSEEIENSLAYVRSERAAGSRSMVDWTRFLKIIPQRAAAIEVLLTSFTDQYPAVNVEGLRLWAGEFSQQARELHYDLQLFAPWTLVRTAEVEAMIRSHCPHLLALWRRINKVLEPVPIIALRAGRLALLLPEVAQLRRELDRSLSVERELVLRRCDELASAIEDALRVASEVKLRYEDLVQRCRSLTDAQTRNVFDEEYRLISQSRI